MKIRFASALAAAVMLASAVHAETAAQKAADLAAPPPAPPTHALTADDVSAWLDGFVPTLLKRNDIAGAVVVVVKDGQVIVERGYGVSDVDTQAPVDPKRTLFRPGSISKLFTWTAVMQLQEQGKLDLDRDVNAYLDFKIPEAFGKPVTLRNLMTHTPGFDERIKHIFATDPKTLLPLGKLLASNVPHRMYPPGEVPAYSNYGASLAGYIVQRVSGERFEDYLAHHIFAPLGMTHSSFEQPLPARLAPDMSKGYLTVNTPAQPFELVNLAPAGALSTTGDDISHFMIAHLNDGSYQGAQILKPGTARLMHATANKPFPDMPGMGLGFIHADRNGHDVFGHGGDTAWFHSLLNLVPDGHAGIFISQNSAGTGDVRGALYQGFMDRYFPAPVAAPLPTLRSAFRDGKLLAGTYITSRRSDVTLYRVSTLITDTKIVCNADGTISVSGLGTVPAKFREIGPQFWQRVHGTDHLQAVVKDGKVVRLATSEFVAPIIVDMPPAWYASPAWNGPLAIATLVFLALVVIFWPIKAILRWRYDRPFPLTHGAAQLYRLARITALLDLLFLVGWTGFLIYGQLHIEVLDEKSDWFLRLLQLFGVGGAIGLVVLVMQVFTARALPWWTRMTDVLLLAAGLATLWLGIVFRLLTVSLLY